MVEKLGIETPVAVAGPPERGEEARHIA